MKPTSIARDSSQIFILLPFPNEAYPRREAQLRIQFQFTYSDVKAGFGAHLDMLFMAGRKWKLKMEVLKSQFIYISVNAFIM